MKGAGVQNYAAAFLLLLFNSGTDRGGAGSGMPLTSSTRILSFTARSRQVSAKQTTHFSRVLASLVLSHFRGLACRMFRLARTAGSRFGLKHRDCRICDGFGLEGYRFGVSWCGITNKVLDTHVVFQEPRLTAVFAEASERHIHDLFSARVLKDTV